MMTVRNLGGHSGCKILLCETSDSNVFVRKISSDKKYNVRLKKQVEKQADFKGKTIRTPQIIQMGSTADGLFFFDMEYIRGITLAQYMNTIQIGSIRTLVEDIIGEIMDMPTESKNTAENREVFRRKIASLKSQLRNECLASVHEALYILERHDWSLFTKSFCHGDLTLENIIVKDGQLYFIDFLDSFFDCWLLDVATLMQDVQVMWSYRFQNEIDINTEIRLMLFRDILIDDVKQKSEKYVREIYYALLLKLIRIFPYTKDDITRRFLDDKTKLVIKTIKSLESMQ